MVSEAFDSSYHRDNKVLEHIRAFGPFICLFFLLEEPVNIRGPVSKKKPAIIMNRTCFDGLQRITLKDEEEELDASIKRPGPAVFYQVMRAKGLTRKPHEC